MPAPSLAGSVRLSCWPFSRICNGDCENPVRAGMLVGTAEIKQLLISTCGEGELGGSAGT